MKLLVSIVALISALAAQAAAAQEPVSFSREIAPILKSNCNGCHRPGKTKGGVDLTSFSAVLAGGKQGATLEPGAPAESTLIEVISGDEPAMPEDAEPLSAQEIALIERWIAEGAKDDTPEGGVSRKPPEPPVYRTLPALSAFSWSPDGELFAVAGHHEVILRSGDGQELLARLIGESPRIESVAFSADGKLLAAAGGAASEFGEIQIWDVATRQLARSIRTSNDTVYGVSFSPDAKQVAVGCADKLVRVFDVGGGEEVMKCDNHIDWVFGTAFSHDGKRLVTVSRDKAVKLIDVSTGLLIDDVNRPREPMLSIARHPTEDLIVVGGDTGLLRVHRMEPRGGRLSEGDDKENSFVRELPRLSGPVRTLAFSADGMLIAAGSAKGEARIYRTDGNEVAKLKDVPSAVFAVAFHPKGELLAVGGYDGRVHLYETKKGERAGGFDPAPVTSSAAFDFRSTGSTPRLAAPLR